MYHNHTLPGYLKAEELVIGDAPGCTAAPVTERGITGLYLRTIWLDCIVILMLCLFLVWVLQAFLWTNVIPQVFSSDPNKVIVGDIYLVVNRE